MSEYGNIGYLCIKTIEKYEEDPKSEDQLLHIKILKIICDDIGPENRV